MSGRTTQVTGINLKSVPLGESDQLMTILTKEVGLIRAIAKGSRKQPSKLGGRMDLFVVNQLLISQGRRFTNLDAQAAVQRITQAETVRCFPKLNRSLGQLIAAQYLGEMTLRQALSEYPQDDLFLVLVEHLGRIERSPHHQAVLPLLTHGIYHLLALAGVAPQVQFCQSCQRALEPQPEQDHFFSPDLGGVLCDPCATLYRSHHLSALCPQVLSVLQHLPAAELAEEVLAMSIGHWLGAERLLRRAAEHHLDRTLQSASLIDSCWRVSTA